MNARSVLFLVLSLVNSFPLNAADTSFSRGFEIRHHISGVILNVPGGEVRSLLQCAALCARSSSCKAFCYSRSTALCHLSQPDDPIVQQYNGSDFECYSPIGCPTTKDYHWHGVRCIKGYTERETYEDARAICTQDGGHLYHFKSLQWDLQPLNGLQAAVGDLTGRLWIGADDLEVQGQYKWSDSSLLASASPLWSPDHPSPSNGRCVGLRDKLYYNILCDRPHNFVCQIDV